MNLRRFTFGNLCALVIASSYTFTQNAVAQTDIDLSDIRYELKTDEAKSIADNHRGTRFTEGYAQKLLGVNDESRMNTIWRARILGESAKLTTQGSETAGVDLRVRSRYHLNSLLSADVYLRGKFESGHSQDFFGDLEPASGVFVREGVIRITPMDDTIIKAGVIDQDWIDFSMLSFRKSFPGAYAGYSHTFADTVRAAIETQYTIPTSTTLSSRTVGREKTPSHIVHRLTLSTSDCDNYCLSAAGALYEYKNLPSTIAFESASYGNDDLLRGGQLNSQFVFPFKGWFSDLRGSVKPFGGMTEVYGRWATIVNQEAADTFNEGQSLHLGVNFDLQDHLATFEYVDFFAESDVVPAYYNSWAIGHTNRTGFALHARLEFKKYNFRLRTYYYKANEINESDLQQDQDFFFFAVETAYDRI